jgi:hypothetical protein
VLANNRERKMKKSIVLLFISVSSLMMAANPADALKGGLKAGSDYSYMWDAKAPKIGFCGGGYFTFRLNDGIAIQTEFLYTMKGTDGYDCMLWPQPIGAIREITNCGITHLEYLEFPVLVKISAGGGLRFGAFAGPAPAIKLRAEHDLDPGVKIEVKGIRAFDFGIVFGGGIGFGRVSIEGRYTLGLVELTPDVDEYYGDGRKNRVISLMAGYSF